jgi:ubiquinol-cytochrome c reductase subunit 7
MATKTSISKLLDPIIARFAPAYQAAVSKELTKYGLRIEDLYDPENDLDVEEALGRLPQEVVDARNQRLKRAMDLSVKHSELPKEIQDKQTPFSFYLKDALAQISHENEERELLDASRPNERSIP